MKVSADEFPGTGLSRRLCDQCGGRILLRWKGRYGEFCCNDCLEKGDTPMTEEATKTATESPIKVPAKKAAAPAEKKPAAAAKKAPAKTVAKAPAKAAAAPAKKAVTKKAAAKKAPRSVRDINAPFREGSTKAKLFDVLKSGKLVEREVLNKICDKAEHSRMLIRWVMLNLADMKYKVMATKEGIQIKKPA